MDDKAIPPTTHEALLEELRALREEVAALRAGAAAASRRPPSLAAAAGPASADIECLDDEEQRLATALDAVLDCFAILTAVRDATGQIVDFRFEYINPAGARNNGIPIDDHIGRTVLELLPGHAATDLIARYSQVVETGKPLQIENLNHEEAYDRAPSTRTFDVRAVRLNDGIVVSWRDVSARQRQQQALASADAALHDTERRHRTLFESLPIIAWVLGPTGEVQHFNRHWTELTGLPAANIGYGWLDAVHPDDRGPVRTLRQSAIARGEAYETALRFRREVDGVHRWHLCRVVPLRDLEGRIFSWLGTATDIDDMRHAEDAVRASEANFRQLADAMPQIVWTATPDGKLDYCNQRWSEIGGTSDGSGDANWLPMIHPDDAPALTSAWESSVRTGHPLSAGEFRLLDRRTGQYRWALGRAVPLRDAAGNLTRWVGTTTDVHEQKLVQEKLLEQSERLHAALSASGTGTFRWDFQTNTLDWDENLDRLFGLPPGQSARSLDQFIALVHPDDRQPVIDRCARCRDLAVDFDMEFRVVWPDGSVHWLDDKGKTFTGPDGKPAYMTGACVDVTRRKVAEQTLRESEARFVQLADAMPQIVWTAGADGAVDYFNRQWFAYSGIDPALPREARQWEEVIHPDDRAPAIAIWVESAGAGRDHQLECRLRRQDGQYRWHLVRALPVRDASGAVVRWFGTSTDVHEQRMGAEELRATETRTRQVAEHATLQHRQLQAIISSLQHGMAIIDPQGRVSYMNPAGLRIHGFSGVAELSELSADNVADRIEFTDGSGNPVPPEQYPANRARRGETVRGVVMQVRRRETAHHAVVEYTAAPVYDVAGNLSCVISTHQDVTARVAADAALRGAQEVFALAHQAGGIGTFEWDIQRNVNRWSPEIETLYGIPVGSFGGTYEDWRRLALPEDLPAAEAAMRASLEAGSFTAEFRIRRPDGAVRWMHARARVLHDDQGRPVRMVGVNVDVTDRRNAEDSLRAAREDAERASRAKDEFLAALSHELRTPLTPVLMTAQILEGDASLSPEVRDDMRTIRRNVELETRLIDDLLDLTRITRGKLQLHHEAIDVHQLLRDAVRTCSDDIAAQKQIRFVLELNAPNPAAWGDAARVSQVFWNLLKNAVKFTGPGGFVTLRTRNNNGAGTSTDVTGIVPDLSAGLLPSTLVIEIQDTGIGIEPAVLPYIFNAFEQGGSQITRQFGGLGLGLAICRALTTMHGGSLTASSAGRGRGATFTIELPTIPAGPPPAAPHPSPLVPSMFAATVASAPTASSRRPRILLVEDHEPTARVLQRLLDRFGYDVQYARTVASAVGAARATQFDLIVSDLGLPDGTGVDLLRQLRPFSSVTAIALSGYGTEQDLAETAEAGFVEHLIKPVSLDRLRDALLRHLSV